jgi:hypothetical protein
MDTQPSPRFAECEYSVFVSYSGADNVRYGAWAQDFSQELRVQLEAALAPHRKHLHRPLLPEPHAFEINGIVQGELSKELRRRMAASFAVVIVVGEGYLASEWCLKELDYLRQLFGADVIARRLFVIALGQEPMTQITLLPQWRAVFAPDQSCNPFFTNEIGRPHIPVLRPDCKAPSATFLQHFAPIREKLVQSIVDDLSESLQAPSSELLIGACVEELDEAVQGFVENLRARGRRVERLNRRQDMGAWIKQTQCLILPFNQAQPLLPSTPGGHLAAQSTLWRGFHKPANQLFALDLSQVSGPQADAPHQAFLGAWAVNKLNPAALLDLLCPPAPPPGVAGAVSCGANQSRPRARVWIESNKAEPVHWKLLERQLESRWGELLKQHDVNIADFPLFSRGMNIESVHEFPLDDADGLILLWGQRERRTLLSHINHVDEILRTPAPSIVAYLSPPNPHMDDTLPAMGWEVLRFNQPACPPPPQEAFVPEFEDESRLNEFLHDVFKRARRRQPEVRLVGA